MQTIKPDPKTRNEFLNFLESVQSLFKLRADTDEQGTIENIRANVDFKSANAWTLIFAIFIASVGLNTNSPAVVIGAMLISPLMGPIVGAGLGLGINDLHLIKRSVRNLAFAVLISILASTAYFLISPLSEVQSELLARTRPTFFDVIIAIFGGAAGIIALSRQEKSNAAIPGVAIATALMPPLCTAGFGIANGELKYFFGALYLFIINSVFICVSTFVFVRYLKFRKVHATEAAKQKKIDRWVFSVALVVIIPSIFLAWTLQRENSFRARANAFIGTEMKFDHTFVVGREIEYSWSLPKIKVSLIGEALAQNQLELLKEKMKRYFLDPKILEINQSSFEESMEKRISEKLNSQNAITKQTEIKLAQSELELQRFKLNESLSKKITSELSLLFPKIDRVFISEFARGATTPNESNAAPDKNVLVLWKNRPGLSERRKLTSFLEQRIESASKLIEHVINL